MIPTLVFDTALKIDWILFRRQIWYILVLSVPLLILSIFISGAFFWGVLGYKSVLSYKESLLFCITIAPSGLVVVQSVCNNLNLQEKLKSTLIGEGLLACGTAFGFFYVIWNEYIDTE